MMNLVNSAVFFISISSMMVLYFIVGDDRPDTEILRGKVYLTEEKRELTTLSPFTFESYVSGQWAKTFDRFVNDNFPFRKSLMQWSTEIRKLRGIELEGQEKVIYIRPQKDEQQKFDKEFQYIKKWVKEFGTEDYPEPIIEHTFARNRVIAVYKKTVG